MFYIWNMKRNKKLKSYMFCVKYDQKINTIDFGHVIFLMCIFIIACALLTKLVFTSTTKETTGLGFWDLHKNTSHPYDLKTKRTIQPIFGSITIFSLLDFLLLWVCSPRNIFINKQWSNCSIQRLDLVSI
jgi:hypothetical protein